MRYQKGQPKHPKSGIKLGTKHKKTLLRVDAYLSDKGIHPVEEILKLMPSLTPADQLRAWQDIMRYTHSPLKPVEVQPGTSEPAVIDLAPTGDLLAYVQEHDDELIL